MLEIRAVVYSPEMTGDLLIFTSEESLGKTSWPTPELEKLVQTVPLEGKFGEVLSFNFWQKTQPRRLLVAGLGREQELDLEKMRRVFGQVLKEAERLQIKILNALLPKWAPLPPGEMARALAEAAWLGSYRFDRYLTEKKKRNLETLRLGSDQERQNEVAEGLHLGQILGQAANFARDLVNEPANVLTPEQLAQRAQKAGEEWGFEVEVLEEKALEKLNMKAFLEVGKASANRPRLIIMRYRGDAENSEEILGLVGKGLTYDSGGLSIKSGESMPTMKYDMGGAAAVIGAISAIARRNLPLNVVAVVAACENLISGKGYRPGDIIGSRAGKSILINSTDAEGRLTLADALHYIITEEEVQTVVDVATLTGAAIVALGHTTTAVLTNDQNLYEKLERASLKSGERVWQLPAFSEYEELNKTPLADLKNTGGRGAGTITAGLFVQEFVQEKPWLHLDIAGTAFASKDLDYLAEGATGVGVRLLYHFAEEFI